MKPLPFEMTIESDIEVMRAETFWTKEPETIAWIDSMSPWNHFLDIGANVGIYSLYAGSRGLMVDAFEPDPKNYARLTKNIDMNIGIKGLIVEHLMAISDKSCQGQLAVVSNEPGASGSQFNAKVDETGVKLQPTLVISTLGASLDALECIQFNQNTHVKIDVDGQELKVLAGMVETLKNPALKSMLIEVNGPKREAIAKAILEKNGFILDKKLMNMPNHSTKRREKEGIPARNLIFRRVNDE